jgi:hypothetical protein
MFHPASIASNTHDFHQPAPNFSIYQQDTDTNAESVLTSGPIQSNAKTRYSGKRKSTSRRRSPKTVEIYAIEQVAKNAVRVSTAVCKVSPF